MDRLLEELSGHGFAASILERLSLADSALFASPETRREVLRYVLKNWSEMDRRSPWGDGALCVSFSLAPGERREIPFILSWYFPALYSAGGNRVGHMYENWFPDAPAVDRFLQRERSRILTAAERFVRTLRDTSFPPVFMDAVSSQLATLVKCSWWSREGEFGIWEGLGLLRPPDHGHHLPRLRRSGGPFPRPANGADAHERCLPAGGRLRPPLLLAGFPLGGRGL